MVLVDKIIGGYIFKNVDREYISNEDNCTIFVGACLVHGRYCIEVMISARALLRSIKQDRRIPNYVNYNN